MILPLPGVFRSGPLKVIHVFYMILAGTSKGGHVNSPWHDDVVCMLRTPKRKSSCRSCKIVLNRTAMPQKTHLRCWHAGKLQWRRRKLCNRLLEFVFIDEECLQCWMLECFSDDNEWVLWSPQEALVKGTFAMVSAACYVAIHSNMFCLCVRAHRHTYHDNDILFLHWLLGNWQCTNTRQSLEGCSTCWKALSSASAAVWQSSPEASRSWNSWGSVSIVALEKPVVIWSPW